MLLKGVIDNDDDDSGDFLEDRGVPILLLFFPPRLPLLFFDLLLRSLDADIGRRKFNVGTGSTEIATELSNKTSPGKAIALSIVSILQSS
mgnify:CR=1 FL=1